MEFWNDHLSANVAALAIILGAGMLAAWLDVRIPKLSPGSFMGVGAHMLCSMFAVELGMRVLGTVPREPAAIMAALFGAALPATIYLLLSAFWLMKLLVALTQGMSPPGRSR